MKALFCTVLLGLGILGLCSCAEQSEPEETAVTTTAVTTAGTKATTTVTTTVTTTAPLPKHRIEKNMRFKVDADSVRPWGCTAELENNSDEKREYTRSYRILEAESGREFPLCDGYEEETGKAYGIQPEETAELNIKWADRYGDLPSGIYLLEVVLEDPEDEEPLVCQTEIKVTAEGYVPVLYIAPEDVKNTGVTLTIDNQTDVGRSYVFVYRLYDEGTEPHTLLLRKFDSEAQLKANNYVAPGETLKLTFKWGDTYGDLLDGHYRVEIEMLADGDGHGKTYHADFDIG
ncbi:MAG: hypothetical protein MJ065_02960 [Oscillospiraceae bacterium]|nr:hypothetical protein [Oscillospiraceae bacterium]